MPAFSHLDSEGNIKMVDVSGKPKQLRTAVASGTISLKPETIELIRNNALAKGNVLVTAKVAGIQAAKQTPYLIPLCHQLALSSVTVEFEIGLAGISCTGTAQATDVTGVEMEALIAVNIALLTIYDMCKAVDKAMVLSEIKLLSKEKRDV